MTDTIFAIWAKLAHKVSASPMEVWTTLRSDIFTSYHPELHYMRGPGPKWHEKHPGAPVASG